MTTFSVPRDYSTILNDTITIDTSTLTNMNTLSGTVTISNVTGSSYYYTGSGISTSLGGSDTITFSDFTLPVTVDWQDQFPTWHRVQDMCEEYPALKIALRNFQTIYELVKDDYDNPAPKK